MIVSTEATCYIRLKEAPKNTERTRIYLSMWTAVGTYRVQADIYVYLQLNRV